jgi:hypothetical protein
MKPTPDPNITDSQKQLSATTVLEACKAGMVVGGIIFPILVALLTFALNPTTGGLVPTFSASALLNVRVTTAWIGFSLIIGVWNLSRFPTIINRNLPLTYDKWTGIFGAVQLYALVLGALRSLIFLVGLP